MATVRLGNTAVREVVGADPDGAPVHRRYTGQATCTIGVDDTYTLAEKIRTITHADGHWPRHSAAPAAWVESDDAALQSALAAHFDCPIGRPTDWTDMISNGEE